MRLRRKLLFGAVAIGLVAAATFAAISGLLYDYPLQLEAPPTSGPLDGQRLVADQVIGHQLAPGTELTISFEHGSFAMGAACNSMGGGYAVRAGHVRTSQVSSTLVGCLRSGVAEQEAWAMSFLDGAQVDRHGDRLVLSKDDTTITLVPRLASERPDAIVGRWTLIELQDSNTVHRPTRPTGRSKRVTLKLSDRVAETTSGCHAHFLANVRHEPAALIFENTSDSWQRSTWKRCAVGDARVDAALRAALRGRALVKRKGDRLTVTSGATVLRFKRASY